MLLACDPELRAATREAVEQAELSIKYEGYIRRQEEEANKLKKYEEMRFQPAFPFETVPGLSAEVRDKLVRIRPDSIGQAQRIPGVTPAAVALLLVGCCDAASKCSISPIRPRIKRAIPQDTLPPVLPTAGVPQGVELIRGVGRPPPAAAQPDPLGGTACLRIAALRRRASLGKRGNQGMRSVSPRSTTSFLECSTWNILEERPW